MDFGIDIIESLGNTTVANSVLIGRIGQEVSTAVAQTVKWKNKRAIRRTAPVCAKFGF